MAERILGCAGYDLGGVRIGGVKIGEPDGGGIGEVGECRTGIGVIALWIVDYV